MQRPTRHFPALPYELVKQLLPLAADQADGDVAAARSFAHDYVRAKGNLLVARLDGGPGDLGVVRDLELRQLASDVEFDVPANWAQYAASRINFIAALYAYTNEERELTVWLNTIKTDENIIDYFGW